MYASLHSMEKVLLCVHTWWISCRILEMPGKHIYYYYLQREREIYLCFAKQLSLSQVVISFK